MAAYDREPMESVALDIGCPDDRTAQLDVRLYQGRQPSGAPPRLLGPQLAFTQAGQHYDSAIAYLFTTSRPHFQKSPGGRIAQRVENRDGCNAG
jgi:hypothetical protein